MQEPKASERVLLVDDHATDLELTLEAFSQVSPGLLLETALGGQEAVALLQARLCGADAAALPALVLLDWKMPGMGGRDVLAWIRGVPALAQLPVVVFSTSREERDMQLATELGANAYLVKPPDFGTLLTVVRGLEGYWRGPGPAAASLETSPTLAVWPEASVSAKAER